MNYQTPTCAASFSLWNLRGIVAYCEWCQRDTDHNTRWHREHLTKGGRSKP